MRRRAASTAQILEKQSVAGDQISKETQRLAAMIVNVSKSMAEQSVAVTQITKETANVRQQSEQVAKATAEQTRAMREISDGARNIGGQMRIITRSNAQLSSTADQTLQNLAAIRKISERNSSGVKETLNGATEVRDRVQHLLSLMDRKVSTNGGPGEDALD